MNTFLILILIINSYGLVIGCNENFNACLKDINTNLNFKSDDNYLPEFIKLLDVSPEKWNLVCPNSFLIVRCLIETKCWDTGNKKWLIGIRDFLIFACHQLNNRLNAIYTCPKKVEMLSEIQTCLEQAVSCESINREFTCLINLENRVDFCLPNQVIRRIYVTMIQPRNDFLVTTDCPIFKTTLNSCNEVRWAKCSSALTQFHQTFLERLQNDEQVIRVQQYCQDLSAKKSCFEENNCFSNSASQRVTFKGYWDSASYFCNIPLAIANLPECFKRDNLLASQYSSCQSQPFISSVCETLQTVKSCAVNLILKRPGCFDPLIFSTFMDKLIGPSINTYESKPPFCNLELGYPIQCIYFNDCLRDLNENLDFFDKLDFSRKFNYHRQFTKLLKIKPETWNQICLSLFSILRCMNNTKCYEGNKNVYGIRDFLIFACKINKKALENIYQCKKRDQLISEINICLKGKLDCDFIHQEMNCISVLGQNIEFCSSSDQLKEIYLIFFKPSFDSQDIECKPSIGAENLISACNEVKWQRCSESLVQFQNVFMINKSSNLYRSNCGKIEIDKDCLRLSGCFINNIYTQINFQGILNSTEYMCIQETNEFSNIEKCYADANKISIFIELNKCNKLPFDKNQCKMLFSERTCALNAIKARKECINLNVYNEYFIRLHQPSIQIEDSLCDLNALSPPIFINPIDPKSAGVHHFIYRMLILMSLCLIVMKSYLINK